jgi:GNAT superfamily N-acetyltransferase
MRAMPEVRPAEQDDLEAVATLTAGARLVSAVNAPADWNESEIRTHLSVYLSSGAQVLVAEVDGRVVGFALARTVAPFLFSDSTVWLIDSLFVAPEARRRGAGHALVAGVAALAGQSGAPSVYAGGHAVDRGMQRFLSRLGFAPAAGHRVVSPPVLLRRLAQDHDGARMRGRRVPARTAVEDIIARRRRAREAGTHSAPVDLRTPRAS